jgi:hypothetical protein
MMKDLYEGLFVWYSSSMNKISLETFLKHKVTIGLIATIAVMVLGGYFLLLNGKIINGKLYVQVSDYNYIDPNIPMNHCQAVTPSCGYCVDEVHLNRKAVVRNEKCYRSI